MRVAVFRARADGERTAARLRQLGHQAVLAPVFDIVPTGLTPPPDSYNGIIFTSAHGVEALRPDEVERLRTTLAFCVGDRTADCARAAGFDRLQNARADAERLAAVIEAAFPKAARLLLVAGRDRKPAIERRLSAAGHAVTVAEIYAAEARQRWPDDDVAALAAPDIAAALHYSRRSAALVLACAASGGITGHLRPWRHHCLSDDAAGPLRAAGLDDLVVSVEPNEASLLRTLDP